MKKILIIEDDVDMATIVEMALAGRYIIKIQNDTKYISEVLLNFKPHLIMIDNYVGQKQAVEIIKEIRRGVTFKNIPFVLFSGHHDIERIAKEINANSFLQKPFDLDDLYLTIEKVFAELA